MHKNFLTLLLAVLAFATHGQSQNIQLTSGFFTAYEEADFEKMSTYWHDSLMLQDVVIAELLQDKDTHYGRETALALWKQAFPTKPNYINITIRDQFESGSFVVTHLTYELSTKRQEKNNVISGDMITVFKFQDGKIIEHFDYGDYFSWDRQSRSQMLQEVILERPEKANLEVAKKYMQAYADGNADEMINLYHNEVIFKDLTAKEAFNSENFELAGKESVSAFWRNLLTNTDTNYMDVKVNGMFYSASFVMISSQFSMILPEGWTGGKPNVFVSIPIKTILQIKDGKVLKHYDFADYNTYNKQIKLQTQP